MNYDSYELFAAHMKNNYAAFAFDIEAHRSKPNNINTQQHTSILNTATKFMNEVALENIINRTTSFPDIQKYLEVRQESEFPQQYNQHTLFQGRGDERNVLTESNHIASRFLSYESINSDMGCRSGDVPQLLPQNDQIIVTRSSRNTDNITIAPSSSYNIKSEHDDNNISEYNSSEFNGYMAKLHKANGPRHNNQCSSGSNQISHSSPGSCLKMHDYNVHNHNRIETINDNPQNLVVQRSVGPFDDNIQQELIVQTSDSHQDVKPCIVECYSLNNYPNIKFEEDAVSNPVTNATESFKEKFCCENCDDIFNTKKDLKQHKKHCSSVSSNSESDEGKFYCSQCSYKCQSFAILKIHDRTHTGEKPYACNFCDYKSGQKNNLAKHILVHTEEKPYSCKFCDYKCVQKNNLVVHERTHTGEKPYACTFCSYRTVQKPNLVKHLYLHTNEKPFSCDVCSYKCVQKTNLLKHKERHQNGTNMINGEYKNKPYRPRQKTLNCPHCTFTCVQKASLDKHIQYKHFNIESATTD